MLVCPLQVAELLPRPCALEVALLVLVIGLGVGEAILHHMLEATDEACRREEEWIDGEI